MDSADQYDSFASDYEWLLSDQTLTGEPIYEELRPVLETLPRDAAILDCACGMGLLPIALARHGYRNVTGSDASEGMIRIANERAGAENSEARFLVCSWEDLPSHFGAQFDLVLCCGNCIGHCPDEQSMAKSLQAMYSILKPGGHLVLDSRNWEKIMQERNRFTNFGVRERDGTRCIPLYVWSYPEEFAGQLTAEVVLVFEREKLVFTRAYPIVYYPFRFEQLRACLMKTGFDNIESDYSLDCGMYGIKVQKPR